MSEKKLQFELQGKGWEVQKKQLDLFIKSMENLKKQGLDVSKVFKSIDSVPTFAKFNKEVVTATKSFKLLGKEVQEYIKALSDQKAKSVHESLNTRLDVTNKAIKKYVELLKDANLETEKRNRIQEKLIVTLGKQAAIDQALQTTTTPGGALGRLAGRFPGIAGRLPGSAAGWAAAGAGIGLGALHLGQQMAAMYSGYIQQQEEARTIRADILTPRVMEAYHGQAGRERYLQDLGGYEYAKDFAERKTWLDLASQGHFGAAMGARSRWSAALGNAATTFGAVGGGLAAVSWLGGPIGLGGAAVVGGTAALYSGLKGFFTDPAALRETTYTNLFMEGREKALRQHGIPITMFDEYMDKASGFSQMRRMLGTGIYGTGMTGVGGLPGQLLKSGYDESLVNRTLVDTAMTGGARAASATAADALYYSRWFGIERAAPVMGAMAGISGFGSQNRLMAESLSLAFTKALDRSELKLERESYIEAVMAATERTMTRYGTAIGGLNETTKRVGLATLAALPMAPSQLDIRIAAQGREAAAQLSQGATNDAMRAMLMGRATSLFSGSTGYAGVSTVTRAQTLLGIPMDMRTMENPAIRALAEDYMGLAPGAPLSAQKAAWSSFEPVLKTFNRETLRSMMVFNTPKEQARLNELLQRTLRLSQQPEIPETLRPEGALTNQQQMQINLQKIGLLIGHMQAPGTAPIVAGAGALSLYAQATGTAITPEMQQRLQAPLEPIMPTDIAITKSAIAGLSMSQYYTDMEQNAEGMTRALVGSSSAAKTFSDALGELTQQTLSAVDNINLTIRALGGMGMLPKPGLNENDTGGTAPKTGAGSLMPASIGWGKGIR